MRLLYTLAWWLALPLVLARLWLRGRQEPGYRQHWGERLGFYDRQPTTATDTIWLHAVSVGETRAAQPLLAELLAQYPQHSILLTGMTPTGRDTATGQINGFITGALGQQGVVGVDGADDLQRGFFLDGLAECGTCGVLSHVFTLWVSDGRECFTEWL